MSNPHNDLEAWKFPKEVFDTLPPSEKQFVCHEFTGIRTLQNYRKRIEYIGLTGLENVLDAGCGMGQWAMALAQLNRHVDGIDKSVSRLSLAKRISAQHGIANCAFVAGSLDSLPYPDNVFDAVFCYSVIMFTKIPDVLSEFFRVLKPGAKLYIMTDIEGWARKASRDSMKLRLVYCLMKIRRILGFQSNITYSKSWFLEKVATAGFSDICSSPEGEASFLVNPPSDPIRFYDSFFESEQTLCEVIAVK